MFSVCPLSLKKFEKVYRSRLEGGKDVFPDYIPVRQPRAEEGGDAPPQGGTRRRLAILRGIHSQYEIPGTDGLFEKTCFKLFKVEMRRQDGVEPVEVLDDVTQAYENWEADAVQRARELPLSISESVYNYAAVHEHTAIGREGLPLPQEKTRKKYSTLACWFLTFCKAQDEEWATRANITDCWLEFLSTPSVELQTNRMTSVGAFAQHCFSGIAHTHTHTTVVC